MSAELDLTRLTEKANRRGTKYYEDSSGEIVAKECSRCGTAKSLDSYHRRSDGFAGTKHYCKPCYQLNYENNKEYYINYHSRPEVRKRNKETTRKWRELNGVKYKKYNREYLKEHRRKNPQKHNLILQRYLARKRSLPQTLTDIQHKTIQIYFKNVCALTGEFDNLHLDHVIPISIGHGGTTYENMIPLRADLNISKSDRCIFDWFYANKERFNLDQRKFDDLIEYLAKLNDMSVEEYEAYVRWCHDNPRDIGEIDEETSAS